VAATYCEYDARQDLGGDIAEPQAPTWVIVLNDKEISPVEFRVFSYLHWRQGANGQAWPSIGRIAADLGLSSSTIRRAVNRLIERGYLLRERPEQAGRGRTNRYRIKAITSDTLLSIKGITGDRVPREKGITSAQKRVSPVQPKHYTRNTTQPVPSVSSFRRQGDADLFGQPEPSPISNEHITFDYSSGRFAGITDRRLTTWREAYPAVNIELEIKRAAIWLTDNPTKRKKQLGRFLSGWFSRTQERGGTKDAPPKLEPKRGDPDWLPDEAEAEEILREAGAFV
jgi:GntR family transcriptional regulator